MNKKKLVKEKSIAFYTQVLGMKEIRRAENPDYRYTLAFVGYADESEQAVIELTYNWDTDSYDLGNAYGHIALEFESENSFKSVENRVSISHVFSSL